MNTIHITPEMAAQYGSAIATVAMKEAQDTIKENQKVLVNAENEVGVKEALQNGFGSANNIMNAGIVEGVGYGMQGVANLSLSINAGSALKKMGKMQKEFDTTQLSDQIKEKDSDIETLVQGNKQTSGAISGNRNGIEIEDEDATQNSEEDPAIKKLQDQRQASVDQRDAIQKNMKMEMNKIEQGKEVKSGLASIVQNKGQLFGTVASSTFNMGKAKQDAAKQVNDSGAQSLLSARQSGFTSIEMMQQAEGHMLDGAVAASGRV